MSNQIQKKKKSRCVAVNLIVLTYIIKEIIFLGLLLKSNFCNNVVQLACTVYYILFETIFGLSITYFMLILNLRGIQKSLPFQFQFFFNVKIVFEY